MKKYLFISLLVMPLLLSCSKEEYESFGDLYGTVTDSKTGDLLPNVTVILSPGGITKVTGTDGLFEFKDLEPQQYTITVQKTGYDTNRKNVTVVVGERIEANITMKVIN